MATAVHTIKLAIQRTASFINSKLWHIMGWFYSLLFSHPCRYLELVKHLLPQWNQISNSQYLFSALKLWSNCFYIFIQVKQFFEYFLIIISYLYCYEKNYEGLLFFSSNGSVKRLIFSIFSFTYFLFFARRILCKSKRGLILKHKGVNCQVIINWCFHCLIRYCLGSIS